MERAEKEERKKLFFGLCYGRGRCHFHGRTSELRVRAQLSWCARFFFGGPRVATLKWVLGRWETRPDFFLPFPSLRPPPSPSGESSNEFHCRRRLSILAPFIAAVLIFLPANIPGDARSSSAVTWFHFVRRFCLVASCWVPLSLGVPLFSCKSAHPPAPLLFLRETREGVLGYPKERRG